MHAETRLRIQIEKNPYKISLYFFKKSQETKNKADNYIECYIYIYIYIYIHTHTHTHNYIYMYIVMIG